jgi:hypothetical protein
MKHRIVWPLAALLGLVILAIWISNIPAQPGRPPAGMPGFAGMPGRFAVAHANDKQIIILDTATGKLYRATDKDILKYSELPKTGGMGGPGFPDKESIEKYRKEFEKKRKEFEEKFKDKKPKEKKEKEDE